MRKQTLAILTFISVLLTMGCNQNSTQADREKLKKEITDSLMAQLKAADAVKKAHDDSIKRAIDNEQAIAERRDAELHNKCLKNVTELNSLLQQYKDHMGNPTGKCDENGITAFFNNAITNSTIAFNDIIEIITIENHYGNSIEIQLVISGKTYMIMSCSISEKTNIYKMANLIRDIDNCLYGKITPIENR